MLCSPGWPWTLGNPILATQVFGITDAPHHSWLIPSHVFLMRLRSGYCLPAAPRVTSECSLSSAHQETALVNCLHWLPCPPCFPKPQGSSCKPLNETQANQMSGQSLTPFISETYCVCVQGQATGRRLLHCPSPPWFLRQCLSLNLALTDSARSTVQ